MTLPPLMVASAFTVPVMPSRIAFTGMLGCTCFVQATPIDIVAGRGGGGAGGATTTGAVGAIVTGAGGGVDVVTLMVGCCGGGVAICTSGGGMNGGGGASISGGGGGFLISSITLVSIGARTTSTTFLASPVTRAYTINTCNRMTNVNPTRWRRGS